MEPLLLEHKGVRKLVHGHDLALLAELGKDHRLLPPVPLEDHLEFAVAKLQRMVRLRPLLGICSGPLVTEVEPPPPPQLNVGCGRASVGWGVEFFFF
jgi:hypothetical protein